jgi:predicted amidophosphoribosyltransferase
VSAAPFAPPLSRIVAAYKDDGRRDCLPVLAALLAAAVTEAIARSQVARQILGRGNGPILLVPVPTSPAARRARGDAPLVAVARAAVTDFGEREVRCADVLRLRRPVADQAGLDAAARARNLEHAMTVRRPWESAVPGAVCLVVDDVLTTGATLLEAARELRRNNAREVLAATICATQRRRPAARSR